MDRITQSMLDEFAKEHDLISLPEDKRFEHFASHVIVKRQYSETFDTSDIVTGSSAGIDAIAILVNGTLISDVDALEEIADRLGYLDVSFVFIQAKRSSSFDGGPMGTFGFAVSDFFEDEPKLQRNEEIKEAAAVATAIYRRGSKFKRGNPACRMYYVTTGKWTQDPTLEARRKSIIADIESKGVFGPVEFHAIGADGVQKLYRQAKNAIFREFMFPKRTVVPEIAGVSQAYLGLVTGREFIRILSDDSGEINRSIFYDNVRDWQDYNPVNSEIKNTLESGSRARFALMNNGVTIIARKLQPTGDRFYIEDFQIVNGCQTSHVLFDQQDAIDESIMIPLRLIGTDNEDLINAIIRATNRQTEVKQDQFFAVTEFPKNLEAYFGTFPERTRLYYERRSRQFDRLSIEKTRIVTQTNLIRAFAAMFLEEPHGITRRYRNLLDRIGKDIFAETHRLEPYYAAAFTAYQLEYRFRNSRIPTEAKPARFQILLATRLLGNPAPLPAMNSHEMTRYCATLVAALNDEASADALFGNAITAVQQAIGEVVRDQKLSDALRTAQFTQALIKHCGIETRQKPLS